LIHVQQPGKAASGPIEAEADEADQALPRHVARHERIADDLPERLPRHGNPIEKYGR
jgi:hypothetical protein